MRETPAKKYARKFMEKLDRPLTADDIAHAYTKGAIFGRSSMWYGIADMTPSDDPDEQIVVLTDLGRNAYDMKVVTGDKYAEFIGDRNREGIPIMWAYLRAMLGTRYRKLKGKKDKEE